MKLLTKPRAGLLPAWLLASALVSVSAAAQAGSMSKTDAPLGVLVAHCPVAGAASVIVRTSGPVTAAQEAQMAALGADIYRRLPIVQSVALRIPNRNLERLEALPFVSHLSLDGAVKKSDQFTVASSEANIAMQQYNVTGQGVCVAVVDSGVRQGQDLTDPSGGLLGLNLLPPSRVTASVNFVAGSTSADDTCGHGTHVAGIVAGNGAASAGLNFYQTFYGIARQSQIANVRVLNRSGQSDVSTVIAGIQWVVANSAATSAHQQIRVLNLSLGHPVGESYTTDPLCQAVEAAWKAGIVVVCAAGNDGRLSTTNTTGLDN